VFVYLSAGALEDSLRGSVIVTRPGSNSHMPRSQHDLEPVWCRRLYRRYSCPVLSCLVPNRRGGRLLRSVFRETSASFCPTVKQNEAYLQANIERTLTFPSADTRENKTRHFCTSVRCVRVREREDRAWVERGRDGGREVVTDGYRWSSAVALSPSVVAATRGTQENKPIRFSHYLFDSEIPSGQHPAREFPRWL